MRVSMGLATVVLVGMLVWGGAAPEESSSRMTLSFTELIGYGMINAYSTNVLVRKGLAGKCLTEEDAFENVERNLAFAKVLQRYALSLKRSSTNEDEEMKKLIARICEAATYLERQTASLKDWLNEPESKSARMLFEDYSEKVEKKIELMLAK